MHARFSHYLKLEVIIDGGLLLVRLEEDFEVCDDEGAGERWYVPQVMFYLYVIDNSILLLANLDLAFRQALDVLLRN